MTRPMNTAELRELAEDSLRRKLDIGAITSEELLGLLDRIVLLERDLRWVLRNNGGECPADHPTEYAEVLADLIGESR